MANRNEKNLGGAPGAFYVDSTCIDCDQCREAAPTSFRRNDNVGMSIVFQQPVTADEIRRAQDALTDCPTESIGCDGTAEQQTLA